MSVQATGNHCGGTKATQSNMTENLKQSVVQYLGRRSQIKKLHLMQSVASPARTTVAFLQHFCTIDNTDGFAACKGLTAAMMCPDRLRKSCRGNSMRSSIIAMAVAGIMPLVIGQAQAVDCETERALSLIVSGSYETWT